MNSRAFTLIELLVVIAIISIMAMFVLANFSGSTREAGVAEATNSVLSFIRKARQNSVAVLEHPNGAGVYPSYGIHFNRNNPDTVILYADCKADDDGSGRIDLLNDIFHFRQSNCDGKGGGRVEELILSNARITDIVFTGINPTESGTHSSFNILFIRPEPTVWFSGVSGPPGGGGGPPGGFPGGGPGGSPPGLVQNFDAGEARITVSNLAGTDSKVIRVNSVGLIVVE